MASRCSSQGYCLLNFCFEFLPKTALGQNITALEVDGVFDDCQEMVKNAFLDPSLSSVQLTSANSINIGRWLPQMFYYFIAYKLVYNLKKDIVFSVPSGNFGNIWCVC